MITRRAFVSGLTLGSSFLLLAAYAEQTGRIAVVGILTSGLCPTHLEATGTRGFVERLRELGHVEGKNLVVECRRSDGTAGRYRDLATELVRLDADAILAVGSAAVCAAKSATTRTPIVAVDMETDPIASGLAASLARPGGNVTGVFLDLPELNGKRLELLKNEAESPETGGRCHGPMMPLRVYMGPQWRLESFGDARCRQIARSHAGAPAPRGGSGTGAGEACSLRIEPRHRAAPARCGGFDGSAILPVHHDAPWPGCRAELGGPDVLPMPRPPFRQRGAPRYAAGHAA